MNPLWLLPSLFIFVGLTAWLGGKISPAIDRVVARFGRLLLGRFVSPNAERERLIESAYIQTTYRTYASKTLLFALLGLLSGGVAGAYRAAGLLLVFEQLVRTLSGLPNTITVPLGITYDYQLVLSDRAWWGIVFGSGLVAGVVIGVLAYVFRWKLPESHAEVRRRGIDEGMPRTVSFMYALSRGGMEFPAVLRTLSDHRGIYGETANEMTIAVREMDLFGRDMISALRRVSRRTPSEQFKTFTENLSSILQSGSNLPDFLHEQYERFQEEAEQRQKEILDLLATIAEGYVTVLVAGVLFLITILLVFGLTTTDTLWLLQMMAYAIIPLANAGFMVFLAQQLEALGIARQSGGKVLDRMTVATPIRASPTTDVRRADGGVAADEQTRDQLQRYDKLKRLKRIFRDPLRTVLWNPTLLLYVLVPLSLLVFLVRLPDAFLGTGLNVRVLDDLVVQSVLLVLIPYAIVRELYKRRIDRIEAASPEMLERLASLNEAGMTVVEGFERVRHSDLGVLTPEVQRIWRDIEYGANVDDALVRFGRRVRTTAITRVVVLLRNAMRASGDMGAVLRIAATQARADLDMRRQRRRQMLTYLVVIYISFFVFLVIILAVTEVLVPSLPAAVPTPTGEGTNRLGVDTGQFARLGSVDKAAYTLVFFHTALVQAICSGYIAGQLGEGSLKDGTKHAAALLTVAYVMFILISSPVASLGATGVTSTGDRIIVQSADLSDGGYVAVYGGDDINNTQIGHTEYLPAGKHETVEIPLDQSIEDNRTVYIVAHRDTDGDREFDFDGQWRPGAEQTDRPYPTLADRGKPGVEVEVRYIGN